MPHYTEIIRSREETAGGVEDLNGASEVLMLFICRVKSSETQEDHREHAAG